MERLTSSVPTTHCYSSYTYTFLDQAKAFLENTKSQLQHHSEVESVSKTLPDIPKYCKFGRECTYFDKKTNTRMRDIIDMKMENVKTLEGLLTTPPVTPTLHCPKQHHLLVCKSCSLIVVQPLVIDLFQANDKVICSKPCIQCLIFGISTHTVHSATRSLCRPD